MHNVHQNLGLLRHESLNEVHIVPLVGRGRHVRDLQFPLVDEVLGGEGVAVLLFKRFQRSGGNGEIVAGPVGVAVAAAQVGAEDPDEIIE